MGYKDENRKHAQGIENKSKYSCPKCKNKLSISKPIFMVVCSKCKKVINKEEIVVG